MAAERSITLIGAGLAGALLARLLALRGWQVDVYERRGDPRIAGYQGGRSINLALAERGRHPLRLAEAEAQVMAKTVMMRGRMVHPLHGEVNLQRYGRDDSEVIWSVHRGELNITLLNLAEQAGARLHFDRRLDRVDFDDRIAHFIDDRNQHSFAVPFRALIGSDGAGSALRGAMSQVTELGERTEFLGHGYKELEIPPAADGGFRIEPNALHIWPRGSYMCIALPNDAKSFTVTLFMANEGNSTTEDPSFATIKTPLEARRFFERDFPDAVPLIPELEHDWAKNPASTLATLHLERWHLDGRALLIGDAAHAMVPFHGQGMNCAFEDCAALAEHLDAHADFADAFAAFEAERKPNARAIQQMALENYLEMRDRVDDADYRLQRELELRLQERHPGVFVPHYAMVSFMRVPYSVALERSEIQQGILRRATANTASIEQVDWAAVDADVAAHLTPLSDTE
ncbi:MAG: FAD-dependent monooxygenase [Rudaea sp.]|uniref:FAD-dependent oxidoreductase n=1 Tax=unclassified Rudaea TaxID=2627037 RepID=UPI0010F77486|nr:MULTISPECIES: FAD-dependent monooxygenase [unclassified Rudaea]MBN8884834.1 FAD-dependent monooxygenase [Rudaea sp.]